MCLEYAGLSRPERCAIHTSALIQLEALSRERDLAIFHEARRDERREGARFFVLLCSEEEAMVV